jgi:hypothetical protein
MGEEKVANLKQFPGGGGALDTPQKLGQPAPLDPPMFISFRHAWMTQTTFKPNFKVKLAM